MAERAGLENRSPGNGTVGSNPTPSAIRLARKRVVERSPASRMASRASDAPERVEGQLLHSHTSGVGFERGF